MRTQDFCHGVPSSSTKICPKRATWLHTSCEYIIPVTDPSQRFAIFQIRRLTHLHFVSSRIRYASSYPAYEGCFWKCALRKHYWPPPRAHLPWYSEHDDWSPARWSTPRLHVPNVRRFIPEWRQHQWSNFPKSYDSERWYRCIIRALDLSYWTFTALLPFALGTIMKIEGAHALSYMTVATLWVFLPSRGPVNRLRQ